jgi:NADP-dependent 3-hydroxy acid dehydrogenase YdfG
LEPLRLEGKICTITGAGSGIGNATALRFVDGGLRGGR